MTYRHAPARSSSVWVVVGDRGHARILATDWPTMDEAREIQDLVNPEGTMAASDVYSDSLGRNRDPRGRSFTDQPETDHRHATAHAFASKVAGVLEKGRTENLFGRLVLIAPPLFLGALRGALSEPLRRLVEIERNEGLVGRDVEFILDRVRTSACLASPNGKPKSV